MGGTSCQYSQLMGEPVPTTRDADHIAAELHGLLLRAGITGP